VKLTSQCSTCREKLKSRTFPVIFQLCKNKSTVFCVLEKKNCKRFCREMISGDEYALGYLYGSVENSVPTVSDSLGLIDLFKISIKIVKAYAYK
jgi:hypothetical protein